MSSRKDKFWSIRRRGEKKLVEPFKRMQWINCEKGLVDYSEDELVLIALHILERIATLHNKVSWLNRCIWPAEASKAELENVGRCWTKWEREALREKHCIVSMEIGGLHIDPTERIQERTP